MIILFVTKWQDDKYKKSVKVDFQTLQKVNVLHAICRQIRKFADEKKIVLRNSENCKKLC